MAAKFEEMSNIEVTSLSSVSGDGEENDISKGFEAIPVQLQNSIRMMNSFQVSVLM